MGRGGLGRVRWGNVGKAAAVLALIGVVAAWPRLSPPPPRLPGDEARPVVTPASRPPPEAPARARPSPGEGRQRRVKRPGTSGLEAVRRRGAGGGRAAHARSAAPRVQPAPPRVAPVRKPCPAPTVEPAVREFSFEVG